MKENYKTIDYEWLTKPTGDPIAECRFHLIGKPKAKMIAIKKNKQEATKVKGYLFQFKLIAPPEWIRVGYFSGFGEKNGLGMGCVGIKKLPL